MLTLKDLIKQKAIFKARLLALVTAPDITQDSWIQAKELQQKIKYLQASIDLELDTRHERKG